MLRLVVLATCLLQAASGSNETNATSVTPTRSHTDTPTHSASHTASLTATPTVTLTGTTTATVTMRTPTETPTLTPSATLYTSVTPIVTPSVSETVSGTETATLPTPTRSVSATVTLTLPSATLTATATLPTPTESRTHTLPTPTQSSTVTATGTATLPTPTMTTTMTLPTATVSWSLTLPTATPSETLTASASLSATASETQTASATASLTESATLSVSETQTVSLTETDTATDTASVSLTATATAGQFVVMSYVLLESRRSLNATWLAKQLFASAVDSVHLPPELMDLLDLRVEAACHVPLFSTTPDDAAAASSHSYPDLERRIARIVGYEGSVAHPEAWYDPTNTTHAFGINMGCAHVNGSWRGSAAAAEAVPLPEPSVVRLRNGTGASAAVLAVSCGVGGVPPAAAAAATVSATVACGTAAVFAVRARVHAANLGREAAVVRGALAEFARDAHALPLRAGFPMPQLSLNPPDGPPPVGAGADEGGGQSLTENFTLWLGIGGTVGALILGALLIIRLTKQGKMGQADAVNVMQDVYEDGVRGGRGGGGGGGGGVIEKQHRSVVRHHTTSDRGSSIARYEAWRQAVGSHMTGAEEVATPVPHYLPQEDDRAAASPPRPSKKVMSGYDNKPTPPSDLFELEAPSSPPVTLEHLKCPRPESTRYASLKDSYESNNPLRPAGGPPQAGGGPPAPPESDAAALEEQSLALLRAALKQKGIDLSGVSSSELRRSALQLVHARDNPLLFCGNCTRPRAPHFIVCRCDRVCYCDDDCKRRYYYYHKAECRA